ncbi:MAG: tryptophan synthase subunit alpha [Saprospiraceae bacterium]
MNRIEQLFQKRQDHVLNVYFTAGFPDLSDTVRIIKELAAAAGVDIIEIGMPYSDPLADGLNDTGKRCQALANGMNVALLMEQIKEVRSQMQMPLVLMGYLVQVMQYGVDRFLADAANAGVDGLILPDLPLYEYEMHFKEKKLQRPD